LFDPPDESDYSVDPETMICTFKKNIWENNPLYPKCPDCDGVLRPNTYLFGDGNEFNALEEVTKLIAYQNFKENLISSLRKNPDKKCVIIEIGCGIRIPSVRKRCEELYKDLIDKGFGSRCEFIRINPDYEDNPIVISPSIKIKQSALQTLKEIEKCSY